MTVKSTIIPALMLLCLGCSTNFEGDYLGGLVRITDSSSTSCYSHCLNFNWENMLPAYMAHNSDFNTDEYLDSYLATVHPAVWNTVKNDEFQYPAAKKRYMGIIELLRDTYNPATLYRLRVPVEIGQYDFDNNAFPIVTNFEGKTMNTGLATANGHVVLDTKLYPPRFHVRFDNLQMLSEFRIGATRAAELVRLRKSFSGYVDRLVIVTIDFRIQNRSAEGLWNYFNATIVNATYHVCTYGPSPTANCRKPIYPHYSSPLHPRYPYRERNIF